MPLRDPSGGVDDATAPSAAEIATPATAERFYHLLRSLPGRGSEVLAAVNGLFGDELAHRGSSLAVPMSFRTCDGQEVSLERKALATTLPQVSGRLCVLVHGLMSTESMWGFPARPDLTYGELLARDRGLTPLYVRYNTGRRISTNGRELASMLRALVAEWPVRVREIDLIGHSMGGLVVRSACHYGSTSATLGDRARLRRPWPSKVKRVVLLGVPNTGASLEVIANQISERLWSLPTPVTRLVGAGIDRRSEGIKDLRWGAVLDEDWLERDPASTQRPELHPVRVPRRAQYLVVAGSLTVNGAGGGQSVKQLLGDALVTPASAEGRLHGGSHRSLFSRVTVRSCPKINHIALANRPAVYDEIRDWWTDSQ
jgi:pimeloyl-ACP methyl ester carboxylesterase